MQSATERTLTTAAQGSEPEVNITPVTLAAEKNGMQLGRYLMHSIESGLYTDYFEKDDTTGLLRFRGKKMPVTLIDKLWEGYLAFELSSRKDSHFTHYYYTSGLYCQDYEEILGRRFSSFYEVDPSWPNYQQLKERINQRFSEWKKLKSMLREIADVQET